MTNSRMTDYYAKRAAEYELIYRKPERQTDLKTLSEMIINASTGLDLLEIACGTGYWTQYACRSAVSILATDCNREVLEIANMKKYGDCPVKFLRSDAYVLEEVSGYYSGALAAFWWSHVPRSKLDGFLKNLHSKLSGGAVVIMLDNRYVEGHSTPISRADNEGNTFQIRMLSDGSTHEVLKNFPTRAEFMERIAPFSAECKFVELDYYWYAEYTLFDENRRE